MAQRQLSIGLGEAIKRLIRVEALRSAGLSTFPEQTIAEINMIVEALNTQSLNLGVDCNTELVSDGVGLFAQSAATSCCRLSTGAPDTSRAQKTTSRRFSRNAQ